MAEILSPGVYVEEVASQAQVIPGTTTSTMGIAGYAPRGPANVATLVQSYEQYSRTFGGLVKESLMGLSMAAFFANGGRRAYVVRVPPADAAASDARIVAKTYNYNATLNGSALSPTAVQGTLPDISAETPFKSGSSTWKFRQDGVAVTAKNTKNSVTDTQLNLVPSQASYAGYLYDGITTLDPVLNVVARGTVTLKYTVAAVPSGVSIAIPAGSEDSPIVEMSVGSATNGANVSFDHSTGRFGLKAWGTYIPAALETGAITADYKPLLATTLASDSLGWVVSVGGGSITDGQTVTIALAVYNDDGVTTTTVKTYVFEFDNNGTSTNIAIPYKTSDTAATICQNFIAVFNANVTEIEAYAAPYPVPTDRIGFKRRLLVDEYGLSITTTSSLGVGPAVADPNRSYFIGAVSSIATRSINMKTGEYRYEYPSTPSTKNCLIATYSNYAWNLNPSSVGAWGNDLKVQIQGSANYYTAATGQYSRFDVFVSLYDSGLGAYNVVEQYEELDFSNADSAVYFVDVINDLSDYVSVSSVGGNVPPNQLNAVAYLEVLQGATSASNAIVTSLNSAPVQPRTVLISYKSGNVTKTITDDGYGNLVGAVSGTANTINYASGAVNVTVSPACDAGTLVIASYATVPEESVHVESFGDEASGYDDGTEGTFDGTNWGRNQFTEVSALAASYKGIYAFNKVDDILQVVLPDFAGSVTVTGDLLDYAFSRTQQPSGGDRFIILTTPKGYSAEEAKDWYRFDLGKYSDYAALYWPWVRVSDPLSNGRPLTMPPLAHVAGVYARVDNTSGKGVGKAPGGTVDGALNYLLGLETNPTLGDRDIVYQNKINPLISSPQTGLAVWGVRTISNRDEWKYVNARRLFMFLEKSVYNSTWWAVFENNGPLLWSKLTAQIGSFMNSLFREGQFAGTSPSQAYFVICDSTNNSTDSINAGYLVIDIGAAPNKPAEFIRLRFQQKSLTA